MYLYVYACIFNLKSQSTAARWECVQKEEKREYFTLRWRSFSGWWCSEARHRHICTKTCEPSAQLILNGPRRVFRSTNNRSKVHPFSSSFTRNVHSRSTRFVFCVLYLFLRVQSYPPNIFFDSFRQQTLYITHVYVQSACMLKSETYV